MQDYHRSLFLQDVFTRAEIDELSAHFAHQPVAHHYAPQNTNNKNLDYDVEGSPVNRIIKPKLADILRDPDHEFFGGAYKEYTVPYQLHIDNVLPTASLTFRKKARHSTAFLIPMMEQGDLLRTAIFDVFLPAGHHFTPGSDPVQAVKDLEPFLSTQATGIDLEEFDHIREPFKSLLPQIPVDRIQTWRMGSVLTWHFDQLHCSTNFARYSITKRMMVIMIN